MDFRFSEEQQELGAIARSFLEEASGPEQIRSAMESELGYDPAVWEQEARRIANGGQWPLQTPFLGTQVRVGYLLHLKCPRYLDIGE